MKSKYKKSLTRVRRSYLSMPTYEREAIDKMVQEDYNQMLEEGEVDLFVQFTKMMCIVLHDYMPDPFGEKRLSRVIGNFRMLHRKFRKVKTAKEVNEALDKEMARIFKKGGFPQEYVENLQRSNEQ